MKEIIVDTSTVITLSNNCLMWVLKDLKQKTGAEFVITDWVKQELVDNPILSKRWRLEAVRIIKRIDDNTFTRASSDEIERKARFIYEIANNVFRAYGKNIKILHEGECAVLAAALIKGSKVIATDEKTTRLLIENPEKLEHLLSSKLHTKVRIDKALLKNLKQEISKIIVLRSSEIIAYAYIKGVFDYFVKVDKKTLISGLLWALRMAGCSISNDEIDNYVKLLEKLR